MSWWYYGDTPLHHPVVLDDHRVPLCIIHFRLGFSTMNHPAIGGTPMYGTHMSEHNGTPTMVNSNPISWAKPCHVYHPPVTIGGMFTITTWVVYCFTHSFASSYIHCYWNSTSRRNPPVFFTMLWVAKSRAWQLATGNNK